MLDKIESKYGLDSYSDADHLKARNALAANVHNPPTEFRGQAKRRTGGLVPFLMFGAMLCLAVFVLLTATGCNTVAGMAADVEAAARGTQEYLADGVYQRSPRPASHTAAH